MRLPTPPYEISEYSPRDVKFYLPTDVNDMSAPHIEHGLYNVRPPSAIPEIT